MCDDIPGVIRPRGADDKNLSQLSFAS